MREEHESYGTLIFNRAHSNGTTLFGSNIKHNEYVTLEINHASIKRDLHSDWVHDEKRIVSVEMSYAQFAEAISSFGMHPGVPVTIRYTEKDGYVDSRPEFVDKRTQINEELKEQMKHVNDITNKAYHEVEAILSKKGNVTKADKNEILGILGELARAMPNTKYIHDMMKEEMNKVVIEAKNEVEAFTKRRLETIANNAIANNAMNKDEIQDKITDNKGPVMLD